MKLVIVESPTKSKTIQKFIGPQFKVLSSYGHIRDLPKSKLGVDIEEDFKPKYIIPIKSRKTIKALKEELKKADSVILATDEDREGEAIAWHLLFALEIKEGQYLRIVFHEITKKAIEEALKNPRKIDKDLVDAQQARRVLDRIVGYKLSPFLWKKLMRGLSAGRVQSVAVRLIAEKEEEIKSFKPKEYWTIKALFEKDNKEFGALLIKKKGKPIDKLEIKNEKEAEKILEDLKDAKYEVIKIERKETLRNPLSPFTTSTLQQESWKRFRLPAKTTMRIAQSLYERGFITYHRTDSLNLSEMSLAVASKLITEKYGKEYLKKRRYRAKGKVQEAHEAVRPTYPEKEPDKLKLDQRQYKLYNLIWRRFIASQMSQAVFDSTSIEIEAKEYTFQASGQTLKFDGFLKVYPLKFKETDLPPLEKEILDLKKLEHSQHFTQPPARYNEASLIKELEKNGIGRPSTYAPTIATIQDRNYVEKNEEKRFKPTEIGVLVNKLLVEHFPKIVDIEFTAKMENNLDEIAEGKKEWTKVLENFYGPFEKNLLLKEKEVEKKDLTENTKEICPECGSPLVIRPGRFGKFYACSKFPNCKFTKNLPPKTTGVRCPKCKTGEIVQKKTRRGKIFYGCNQFPNCDFALWDKPLKEKCPKCGSLLVETKKGKKCSNKDCEIDK